MKFSENGKIITCFLPKGGALEIMRLLFEEKGVNSANAHTGRGEGLVRSISYGQWAEVDVLSVAVTVDQADEVFWFIYERAGVGLAGGGFLFQAPLVRTIPFVLSEVAEES